MFIKGPVREVLKKVACRCLSAGLYIKSSGNTKNEKFSVFWIFLYTPVKTLDAAFELNVFSLIVMTIMTNLSAGEINMKLQPSPSFGQWIKSVQSSYIKEFEIYHCFHKTAITQKPRKKYSTYDSEHIRFRVNSAASSGLRTHVKRWLISLGQGAAIGNAKWVMTHRLCFVGLAPHNGERLMTVTPGA